MVNQAYPSLNGIEPSWADIAVYAVINGISGVPLLPMSGISALKWSRKVEVGKKRGASGGRVMARTTGQLDQDGTLTIYRGDKPAFVSALATVASQNGYVRGNQAIISWVSFDIIIQYSPPNTLTLLETHLKGCKYLGDSDETEESADPNKIEITIDPMEIADIVNGQEIVLL